MKTHFYVHGHDNPVNLSEDSDILKIDWGKRFKTKYFESVAYHEIYNREDYFKGDCVISPGDIVVDCGGNIGVFTAIALDMGASRVLSFEPFEKNYKLIKKNNPNAEVYNLAVSNKSDDIVELLCTSTNESGGHTILESQYEMEPGHFEHRNIYVKTITLNDIISNNFLDHIDFLKIDTEGSELLILDGLSDDNLEKIRNISIEYHSYCFDYDENVYEKFQKRFLNKGFNVFAWYLDNRTRMMYISKGDVFRNNPKHK